MQQHRCMTIKKDGNGDETRRSGMYTGISLLWYVWIIIS
jgi:hypothetical protein